SGLSWRASRVSGRDPLGDQQASQNGSPGQNDDPIQNNGPGDDQSGKKHPPARITADTLLGVQADQLNVQLLPRGNDHGGQQQGQGGNGQNGPQGDNPGDPGGNQA